MRIRAAERLPRDPHMSRHCRRPFRERPHCSTTQQDWAVRQLQTMQSTSTSQSQLAQHRTWHNIDRGPLASRRRQPRVPVTKLACRCEFNQLPCALLTDIHGPGRAPIKPNLGNKTNRNPGSTHAPLFTRMSRPPIFSTADPMAPATSSTLSRSATTPCPCMVNVRRGVNVRRYCQHGSGGWCRPAGGPVTSIIMTPAPCMAVWGGVAPDAVRHTGTLLLHTHAAAAERLHNRHLSSPYRTRSHAAPELLPSIRQT